MTAGRPAARPASSARTGVLVMAHGTPSTLDQVEAFYTSIRRGRPPTGEQLADLRRRYTAIGGTSPLAARTRAQVAALAARLDAEVPGRYVVRFGAKHTAPSIEEAATDLATAGPERVVGLVLAPHRSSLGSEEYLARAGRALASAPGAPPLLPVRQWHDRPGFAELWAARVRAALAGMDVPAGGQVEVVFTAHSLPQRTVAEGDPYTDQVAASAAAAAAAAGVAHWRVAWQSAGRTADPWIGPDLLTLLRQLAESGTAGVVVCPLGFVADHLEVLYDLDIEARSVAEGWGLRFARAASLNDDPGLIAVLADAVRQAETAPRTPSSGGSSGD